MQSIDTAGSVLPGGFQAGLLFADGNLNQVGNTAQVLERMRMYNPGRMLIGAIYQDY